MSVVHLLVVPFVRKQVAAVQNHCLFYPHFKTRKVDFIFLNKSLIAEAKLSEFRTLYMCYKSVRFVSIWPSFFFLARRAPAGRWRAQAPLYIIP